MRRTATRLCLIGVLLSPGCGGRQGSADLHLTFRSGDIKRLSLQTQMDVNLTMGDRQIPVSLGWDLDLEVVVNNVDARGIASITAYVESFNVSRRGGPALGRDQGVMRYFHSLINILAKMLTDFPRGFSVDGSGRLVEPLDQQDFFELLFPMLPVLPPGQTPTGQPFSSKATFVVPILGALDIEQNSRFDSIRSGDVCRIKSELMARTPSSSRLRTLGIDLDILSFEQSGAAELDFLPSRGDLVRRDLQLDFNIRLSPGEPRELPASPIKVYIHIAHSVRSRR